mgnify:CR=1 FL=1
MQTVFRATYTGNNHNTYNVSNGASLYSGLRPAAGTYRVTAAKLTTSGIGKPGASETVQVQPSVNGVGSDWQSVMIWNYTIQKLPIELTINPSTVQSVLSGGGVTLGVGTSGAFYIHEPQGCVWDLTITWEYTYTTLPAQGSVDIGQTLTASFTPISSAARHKLVLRLGSSVQAGDLCAAGATGASVSVPEGWISLVPSATSRQATLTLETWIGGSKSGESSRSVTLNVPSTVKPTVGALSVSRRSGDPTESLGKYVQGKSLLQLNIAASTPGTGSSLTGWKATIGGASYAVVVNGSEGSVAFVPAKSGTVMLAVTLTDARGKAATRSMTLTVDAYAAPQITAVEAGRCLTGGTQDENGTGLRVKATITATLLDGSLTLENTVQYREQGVSVWEAAGSLTSGTALVAAGVLDVDKLYDVLITSADGLSTTTYQDEIQGAACLLSILRGGVGMCIGGVATVEGALESKLPIIGGGVAHGRNLLDNGDFGVTRVNQRGVSGTISAVGYFLDRWKLTSGNVTIGDDCITLNGTMVQISETAWGTDVTASVKLRSGTATIAYDDATKTTTIASSGGVLLRAKLEMGALSTIEYDPPQDYGTELLKCQRFCVAYPYAMPSLCAGFINTTAEARLSLALPVMMRVSPSISFSAVNQFRVVTNGTTYIPTALSAGTMSGNSVWLTATISGGPVNQPAVLRVLTTNNICLSADL